MTDAPHAAKILYIEDDPGLGQLVRRALQSRGFSVELATDGMAGLARIREGGVDLVALDHHMPGQTGLDILPLIREIADAPPVIYVTGSEDSRVAVAALKAGAVDYVWKDVQGHFRELLAEAAATALQQERMRREAIAAELAVREARDRAELLLVEVNHRVANSLAIVAAMARLQTSAVRDPAAREALQEMQARIAAIAGIHRSLYTSDDVTRVNMRAYLGKLVEELAEAMKEAGREHRIVLDAQTMEVPTDKAVSVGVIVTELVTNAHKYAYPDESTGEIRVSFAADGEGMARLTVADDGIGWSEGDAPKGTGLGTRIIRSMAANLRSAVDFERGSPGTRATLVFQL
jgi:two-component sensor histidine kinase